MMSEKNGTVTLESVRAERELLEEQVKLTEARATKKLLESWEYLTDYTDFSGSDLWYRLRDDSGRLSLPPSVVTDRRHGANWPMWRTWQELSRIRQRSRVICETNPYAIGFLDNYTNYIIGTGCTYKAALKKGISDDRQFLADQFQEFILDFLKRNRWNVPSDPFDTCVIAESRERECVRRVVRDGEAFIRLHFQDDGTTLTRWNEPEQIQQPPGFTEPEGWFHGILHQMFPFEDVETREAYYVFWQDPTSVDVQGGGELGKIGEQVPAGEMIHVMAPGVDSTIGRGTPMFKFGVADAFERALKLERNASAGAAVRAAIAMIWKHVYNTQGQVQSLADALASRQRIDPLTGQKRDLEEVRPGKIMRVPEGQEPVPVPEEQAENYLAGVQGDLRAGLGAFCAPEYWSGSTEGGNYSNLETASAPTVKMGEAQQTLYKAAFSSVVWKAARWATEKGVLPKDVLTLCELQIEAPKVMHRDALEKSQQDQIDINLGKKSRQTAAMEDGLDWDQEAKNNEEFTQRFGATLPGLELPGEGDEKKKLTESKDAQGHEHKGSGPGGGQFTGKGDGSSTSTKTTGTATATVSSVALASPKDFKRSQTLARQKMMSAPKPSEEEIKTANEKMDRIGAADYEMQIRGASKDRAASRKKLLAEFGDGETCPCCYCGMKLTDKTVTRDKIYTAREGGRYRHSNLVPACLACNQARGDKQWTKIKWSKQ
jgi:hypothetical protein